MTQLMCLIVDNDVIHRVLTNPDDTDFHKLHEALFTAKGAAVRIAYGGRLRREYEVSSTIMRFVLLLERAGRAYAVSNDLVDEEENVVASSESMASNDTHIVALARVANIRLLATNDKALQSDFTNTKLLQPKGRVYQRPAHAHLLLECCGPKTKKR